MGTELWHESSIQGDGSGGDNGIISHPHVSQRFVAFTVSHFQWSHTSCCITNLVSMEILHIFNKPREKWRERELATEIRETVGRAFGK